MILIEGRQKKMLDHRSARPNAELAARQVFETGNFLFSGLKQRERLLHVFEQGAAFRGQLHPFGETIEQFDAKARFQLLNGVANRGLRDV
ncbi:hypothetical protein D3C77_456480 [compost metagenome]